MDADLIFPATGSPQGFSSLAMSKWDGKPEPIVRELLQNCLDAAREAERERAEVCFTIAERPLADLPGIDAYRKAFTAVCDERASAPGAGEKRAIEGINGVLERGRVRLLFCRDNGVGLAPGGLDRVLTEGNTDKSTGGGTTGVGHLTAFAASDLRYVLYAGRSRANGAPRDAASGHAVLASHRSPDSPDTGIDGNGYLLRPGQQSLFARGDKYPDHAPPLLADEMARIEDTGSVVCITGFNDFRDDPAKAVRSLRRVAATHFLAAIALDGMVVRVRDADGEESVVDRAALEGILGHVSIRDQRVRSGGALVPGQQAWRAWQCFDSGRELPASGVEGVTIRIRPRLENEGYDSRVQLYRDGMWITNEAPHLRVNDFGGSRPFDAVVLVERGELYELVRDAEGPEHLGLDRERIIVKGGGGDSRWKRLRELLAVVRERLRDAAGERERDRAFTPTDFAIVRGDRLRTAEPLRPYRPRLGANTEDDATVPQTVENGGDPPDGPNPKPDPKPDRPRRLAPKPGSGVPLRSSVLPRRNAKGEFDTLRVVWRMTGRGSVPDMVGVRVRVPSGSDSTCENPLALRWLELQAIEHPGGTVRASGRGATELAVPPADGTLTITLAEPITDPNAVEVDVVRRRRGGDGDG